MMQNPMLNCDSYKLGHMAQYPEGTQFVYSNFTPRSSKHFSVEVDKIVFFGLQGFLYELNEAFKEGFFSRDKKEVLDEISNRVMPFVGPSGFDISKVEALYNLGYLPIKIKALPEGSLVNIGVPVLTIVNTLPEFYWITNFLETWMSCELWKSSTSATIAYEYRKILEEYAIKTGAPLEFVDWQAHDFSMRGMSGVMDAAKSGAAHLTSFTGTDCLPALGYLDEYYDGKNTFLGGSVPATEHSVMAMGGKEDEIETFRRLITQTYPAGIVSIVSDTWDFWKVITEYSQALKEEILARKPDAFGNAKVVFRPDSGSPKHILCGYKVYDSLANQDAYPDELYDDEYEVIKQGNKYYHLEYGFDYDGFVVGVKLGDQLSEAEAKGAVECLWDIFGGTTTNKGYKVLDSHVGLIYGDSITISLTSEIMERLEEKGFASSNVVLGVGSYTFQYTTRDSLGFAMKATYGVVNGESREIFKDPKTDNGTKKSAKGLLRVEEVEGGFKLFDQQSWEEERMGALQVVYEDGKLYNTQTIQEIRNKLKEK